MSCIKELDSEEEDVYDTGPRAVDDIRWTDDPNLRTGEYLLDSGTPILMRPTAPYYYEDAVQEKIVHEVLVPQMLELCLPLCKTGISSW